MAMEYGWMGKILRVDLSTGSISTLETADYVPQYVGGLGIAARIAWDELAPGVGALDPGNMLFTMVGPLSGTVASGAGRGVVAGIAPQQRPSAFSRSGFGGHWGAEVKYAGYDGIVCVGRADKPVYLWVNDERAGAARRERPVGHGHLCDDHGAARAPRRPDAGAGLRPGR